MLDLKKTKNEERQQRIQSTKEILEGERDAKMLKNMADF
jgi:hypothetical protein